jgi:hypothetical protein
MSDNYNFAQRFCPDVVQILIRAEKYLCVLNDPLVTILLVGLALEKIVVHIGVIEGIFSPGHIIEDLNSSIWLLKKKSSCTPKEIQWMHEIREKRNVAIHEGVAYNHDAGKCLSNVRLILKRCVKSYKLDPVPVNPHLFHQERRLSLYSSGG